MDRLNHLHSDANQKLARDASDDFSAFSSEQAGLGPILLKNLDARAGLSRFASDKRAALNDADRASGLLKEDWYTLRFQLYRAVGLDGVPTDGELAVPNLVDPFKRHRQATIDNEPKLVARIGDRLKRVEAIVDVLKALADGRVLELKQARDDLDKTIAQIEKLTPPATTEVTPPAPTTAPAPTDQQTAEARARKLIDTLNDLRLAVVDAGKQALSDQRIRAKATATQAALLDDINKSRDPASAYALVALIGAGLGQRDLDELDALLEFLSDKLAAITPPSKEEMDVWPAQDETLIAAIQRAADADADAFDDVDQPVGGRGAAAARFARAFYLARYRVVASVAAPATPVSARRAASAAARMRAGAASAPPPGVPAPGLSFRRFAVSPQEIRVLDDAQVGLTATTNGSTAVPATLRMLNQSRHFTGSRLLPLPRRALQLRAVATPPPAWGDLAAMRIIHLASAVSLINGGSATPVAQLQGDAVTLAAASTRLSQAGRQLSTGAAALRVTGARFDAVARKLGLDAAPPPPPPTEPSPLVGGRRTASASVAQGAGGTSDDVERGKQFLLGALGNTDLPADQVLDVLTKAATRATTDKSGKSTLNEKDLAQIGKIVSDVRSETQARTRRLLDYLAELYRVRINLLEENARHYNVLAGLGALEIRRWQTVAFVNANALEVYGRVTADREPPPIHVLASDRFVPADLFLPSNFGGEFEAFGANVNQRGSGLTGGASHAAIPHSQRATFASPQDPILGTFRRLAETARDLQQYASPNDVDPLGLRTSFSMLRLKGAIEAASMPTS